MSVYDMITNRILELLEKGIVPWQRPWSVPMPRNLSTGKDYRGVNILLLSFTNHKSPYWLTYMQAKDLGGFVRAGEKGLPIVFWKLVNANDDDKPARVVPLLRYYTVFNVEQCDNITVPEQSMRDSNPIGDCEAVMEKMPNKPSIQHGGDRACYIPSRDSIMIPHRKNFNTVETYYGTLFHEAVHSTGHENRLSRNAIAEPHAFGSESYSKEELIAEIGSGFLCGMAGISSNTIQNQVNYIGHWLRKLSDDKKLIITAASQAQRACDYILDNMQGKQEL